MKRRYNAAAAALAVLAVLPGAVRAQALKVGSKAPAIKVAKWVKGTPVTNLADGKNIHVIEFWATWCGPCRVSIPHLTEMAKKYRGKVDFTGVSIQERDPNYLTKVAAFVKDMGPKMNYNVCADNKSENGFMATNWMTAAEQGGIPTAFVVGKDGKILWIGHPMEMEPVLEKVVAGKFDSTAEAARAARAKNAEGQLQTAMRNVMKLAQDGKNAEAVAAIDKVIADYPEQAFGLEMFKYTNLLLKTDEAAAMALAAKLFEGAAKDNAMALNALAWPMVDDEQKLKAPDLDLALKIAQRAVELTKEKDFMILDTLAYVHYKKGDAKEALACQEKAVALMAEAKDLPENVRKEINDRLALYKSKQ